MTLSELQRIKQWHIAHKQTHPLECQTWDAMLTLWLMGWVGWLPAFAFEQGWLMPVCALAMFAPSFYAGWRQRAHRARRLRCDWLHG
jgi:hypothetical protein